MAIRALVMMVIPLAAIGFVALMKFVYSKTVKNRRRYMKNVTMSYNKMINGEI